MENETQNQQQDIENAETKTREFAVGPIQIGPNELGIADNTMIKLDPAETVLTFSQQNGKVVMSLSVTFEAQPAKIALPGSVINADSAGVFNLASANSFTSGQLSELYLVTDAAGGVVIRSAKSDFSLITNAKKKLSGQSFK